LYAHSTGCEFSSRQIRLVVGSSQSVRPMNWRGNLREGLLVGWEISTPVRPARAQMSARDRPDSGVAYCVTVGFSALIGMSRPKLSTRERSTQPF